MEILWWWIIIRIVILSYLSFVFIKKKTSSYSIRYLLLLVFLVRFILVFLNAGLVYAEEEFVPVKDNCDMHEFFLQDLVISFTVLTVTGVNPILGLASSIVISILFEDSSTLILKKLDDWSIVLVTDDQSPIGISES